jgi:hypothetical protein
MLKITQPYVRETPVVDTKEGRAVVVKIEPPGFTIGFRLRGGRQTWYLSVLDAYMAARYTANPVMKQELPKHAKSPSIKDEILSVLRANTSLNIAQVMQKMKEKSLPLKRNEAGTILELMKDAGLVTQHGFNYELVKK